jgi:hypothetical protein
LSLEPSLDRAPKENPFPARAGWPAKMDSINERSVSDQLLDRAFTERDSLRQLSKVEIFFGQCLTLVAAVVVKATNRIPSRRASPIIHRTRSAFRMIFTLTFTLTFCSIHEGKSLSIPPLNGSGFPIPRAVFFDLLILRDNPPELIFVSSKKKVNGAI